jgi:glycerol-3-phosphate acyltransferase PlsX
MPTPLVIALDAMGGDHAPDVALAAAEQSARRHADLRFCIYGDRARIEPLLERHPGLAGRYTISHTEIVVAMNDKPSQALRRGRWKSSMWLTIEAVKKGEAACAISGGNTGALMAMATFCLKTLPGIERPAIAAFWPTVRAQCLVLDVGANVGASASQLIANAFMGAAMAHAIFDHDRPSVALLNIGVEEIKGLDDIKRAHAALRAMTLPFDYRGYVEGDRIGHDAADVIVTDGFTGNVAIKTAEGTARQVAQYLREAMGQSLLSQLGGFIAQDGFRSLKVRMDPRRSNGGIFLGLDGLVIKSHGSADALGYANAIELGYEMVRADLLKTIAHDLAGIDRQAVGATVS